MHYVYIRLLFLTGNTIERPRWQQYTELHVYCNRAMSPLSMYMYIVIVIVNS